jgi:hypothetical protein
MGDFWSIIKGMMEEKRSMKVKEFIRKNADLFWYSPENKEDSVSDELLVETILNYGTFDDVFELFEVMGIREVARIFREMLATGRKRGNYFPPIRNYFELFFNRYVP